MKQVRRTKKQQADNPFDRDAVGYFADRLATDAQVEIFLGWASGTAGVKRSRGTWPFPTIKAGRNNRTRVGDVFKVCMPNSDEAA